MTTSATSTASEVPHPLLRLLDLARQARHTATGPELQFLLVNRTYNLCPYLLGAYWISEEGVVAQSGVSHVEQNAPFIQWLSGVCTRLGDQSQPIRVTSDVLTPADVAEWSEHLPASGLWLPVRVNGSSSAGLLLCRQEPWEDADIGLLQEWLDTWAHAWKKLHAPTLQGEIRQLLGWLGAWLPSSAQLATEMTALKRGTGYFVQEVIMRPWRWPVLFLNGLWSLFSVFLLPLKVFFKEGPAALWRRCQQAVLTVWQDKGRRWWWVLGLLLVLPVRLTVLAPAELVPAHPAVIRVPTEGVIDEFFVTPNQTVVEGQALFRLDLTTLTSRLNVAQQEIQVASSEYRQSALQSLTDAKSRTQLSGQEGKAAERQVEVAYLKELLSKAQIKSPRAGVVLFDDPSEWIGKPVVAGEKIMVVTTEGDAEIEAWLPVGDAITLPTDASVTLYLNASPLSPVGGQLRYVGHEAIQRPDGSYAYRLRAKLVLGEHAPRVGLRGTAKVSGQYVPLVYWVLRKPLGSIRQLLGI